MFGTTCAGGWKWELFLFHIHIFVTQDLMLQNQFYARKLEIGAETLHRKFDWHVFQTHLIFDKEIRKGLYLMISIIGFLMRGESRRGCYICFWCHDWLWCYICFWNIHFWRWRDICFWCCIWIVSLGRSWWWWWCACNFVQKTRLPVTILNSRGSVSKTFGTRESRKLDANLVRWTDLSPLQNHFHLFCSETKDTDR